MIRWADIDQGPFNEWARQIVNRMVAKSKGQPMPPFPDIGEIHKRMSGLKDAMKRGDWSAVQAAIRELDPSLVAKEPAAAYAQLTAQLAKLTNTVKEQKKCQAAASLDLTPPGTNGDSSSERRAEIRAKLSRMRRRKKQRETSDSGKKS